MPIIEFTTKQVDNFLIKMEKITAEITGIINDITKINNQVIKSKSDLRRVISLTKKIATLTSRRELTNQKYIKVISSEQYISKKRIHDNNEKEEEARQQNSRKAIEARLNKSATNIQKHFKRFVAVKNLPKIRETTKAKNIIKQSIKSFIQRKKRNNLILSKNKQMLNISFYRETKVQGIVGARVIQAKLQRFKDRCIISTDNREFIRVEEMYGTVFEHGTTNKYKKNKLYKCPDLRVKDDNGMPILIEDNGIEYYQTRAPTPEETKEMEKFFKFFNILGKQIYVDGDDEITQWKSDILSSVVNKDYFNSSPEEREDMDPFEDVRKYIDGFVITYRENLNIRNVEEFNIEDVQFMLDVEQKFITTSFTGYDLNEEATSMKDLFIQDYNEYVKKNFRPNSCFLTTVINKFHHFFEKKYTDGKRKYKDELTYEYLCKLMNFECKPSHNYATIGGNFGMVKCFFEKFKFSLFVYSPMMSLLYKFIPNGVSNGTLRILVSGNHIYELNDNLKKLEQMAETDDERLQLSVSDKYYIHEEEEVIDEITLFYEYDNSDHLNGLFKIIKDSVSLKHKKIKVITSNNMNNLLYNLRNMGYTPIIVHNGNFISRLTFNTKKLSIMIECAEQSEVYGIQVSLNNLEEYNNYQSCYNKFHKSIIKVEHLSDYHESVVSIHKEYRPHPICGHFENIKSAVYGLDENKAYTECLQSITHIPVFSYFDVYETYDNHEIEDLTFYIIHVEEETKASTILFGAEYTRTTGEALKQANGIKYKILKFLRPYKIEPVEYSKYVKELYDNTNISIEQKKLMMESLWTFGCFTA